MTTTAKRALIIGLPLLLIGILAYNAFLNSAKPGDTLEPGTNTQTPSSTVETPVMPMDPLSPVTSTAPKLPLAALSQESIVDYWINHFDGQAYYITTAGVIKRADPVGTAQNISSSRFEGEINRVIPSAKGEAVIIVSGEPRTPSFKIFDVEHTVWRALPVGTTAADWTPTGSADEIIYLRTTPSKTGGSPVTTLNRYSLIKTTSKTIATLAITGVDLTRISQDLIYLTERPSRDREGSVRAFDLKKGTFSTILPAERGLWTQWTPGSGAFSFSLDAKFAILNENGSVRVRPPLMTIPSKCTFDGADIYCAVPFAGLTVKQLPDSYLQRSAQSADNFLMFSPLNPLSLRDPKLVFDGEKEKIAIDATKLTKRGSSLYFINKYDGLLYQMSLK